MRLLRILGRIAGDSLVVAALFAFFIVYVLIGLFKHDR